MKLYNYIIVFLFLLFSSQTMSQKWLQKYESANDFYNKYEYDTAAVIAESALEDIGEKEVLDSNYYNLLYLLSGIYQDKNDQPKALDYGIQSLEAAKTLFGTNHRNYGLSASRIGRLYEYGGEYDSMMKFHEIAKEVYAITEGKKSTYYASSLQSYGAGFFRLGNYKKSRDILEDVKNLWEKELGTDHSEYPIALNNLALVYEELAEYKLALDLFYKTDEINRKTIGESHIGVPLTLINIGDIYSTLGDYENCLKTYLEVENLWMKYQDTNRYEYVVLCNNLGGLYRDLGDYENAEKYYDFAVEIITGLYGKENPVYASVLLNRSYMYMQRNMLEEAASYSEQAIEIVEKILGKDHPRYAAGIYYLGAIYYRQGKYAKALEMHQKAYNMRVEIFGIEHPEVGVTAMEVGLAYGALDSIPQAKIKLREALENIEMALGVEHPKYINQSMKASIFFLEQDDLESARKLSQPTIDRIRNMIWQNFGFLSEKEQAKYRETLSEIMEAYYQVTVRLVNENPEATGDLFDQVTMEKGLLLRSSSSVRTKILNSGDTVLQKKYETWLQVKKELLDLLNNPERNLQTTDSLENVANNLERDLVRSSGAFEAFKNGIDVSWREIQKGLVKNEVVLEFFHFKDLDEQIVYYVLLLDAKMKYPKLIQLFNEEELKQILNSVSGSDLVKVREFYKNNGALYQMIMKSLEKQIKKYQRLYISPSGLLHRIAFHCLSDEHSTLLCANHELRLISSSRQILLGQEKLNIENALIIGGVDYDKKPEDYKVWTYLPGTQKEIQVVSDLLVAKSVQLYSFEGAEALEEGFKKSAPLCDLIHLSTHGFFFPDPEEIRANFHVEQIAEIDFRGTKIPTQRSIGSSVFLKNKNPLMRSGLVFAGANQVWNSTDFNKGDDGVLTAKEVAAMDLSRSKLVVLSACETGLGDIVGTEGVYGLQRAFKMAGAGKIVMSLWKVPDKETQEFMTYFYTFLIQNLSIEEAFSKAQNEMSKKYEPYFWAAFVLLD